MEPIILASSSPRRQEILKLMHIPYQVVMPNVDETTDGSTSIDKVPEILAKRKVEAVVHMLPPKQEIPWVLGADTIVSLDDKIYGKPSGQDQAVAYLKTLQGRTHRVITSIALFNGRKHIITTRTSITSVTFNSMTDAEIEWFASTGDWHGAAGGYRIQGLASCFIQKIEGTNSCVVGLPIFELYDILKSQGYSILD